MADFDPKKIAGMILDAEHELLGDRDSLRSLEAIKAEMAARPARRVLEVPGGVKEGDLKTIVQVNLDIAHKQSRLAEAESSAEAIKEGRTSVRPQPVGHLPHGDEVLGDQMRHDDGTYSIPLYSESAIKALQGKAQRDPPVMKVDSVSKFDLAFEAAFGRSRVRA